MKKTKKLFLFALAVTLFAVVFCFSASALEETGQCGENATWSFNSETGELVISGTGEVSYEFRNNSDVVNNLRFVIIEDGITSIGDYVLRDCYNLQSITIPDSLMSFGSNTFYMTANIKKVYISNLEAWCNVSFSEDYSNPLWAGADLYLNGELITDLIISDGIESIGTSVFSGCGSLKSVTIGNSVKTIGYGAFGGCRNIETVTILDGVTSIGAYAFHYCSSLKTVTIPESVTSMGSSAFYSCDEIEKVYISDIEGWLDIASSSCLLNYIGVDLYLNGELLTDLIIPEGVESIGSSVFSGCGSLESVTIPNSVTSIGQSAFSSCVNLKSVTIPDSVRFIDPYAFYDSVESITILNPDCYLGDSIVNNYDASIVICGYKNSTAEAYANSNGNTFKVYCPHNNTTDYEKIGPTCTTDGREAGTYCSDCEEWVIGGEVIYASHTDENSDKICDICGEEILNVIETGKCGDNVTYTIYDNGKLVISGTGKMYSYNDMWSYSPFYDKSITSAVIENGITNIGAYAFYGCTSLTSVTIPDSVTNIGEYAFYGCTSLVSVTIPDSVTRIDGYVFYGCTSLTSVTIPDSVTNIGEYAFYGCTSLKSVIIPDSVTEVSYFLFSGCTSLETVVLSKNLTKIGENMFSDCVNLKNITIPYSVTSIVSSSFKNCTSLTSITIPDSVTNIGYAAFKDCKNLKTISIGKGVTQIDAEAFKNCIRLEEIVIPEKVISIYTGVFDECIRLSKITVENPDCVIPHSSETFPENATLYGYEGSTLQTYAEDWNRKFVVIGSEEGGEGEGEVTPDTPDVPHTHKFPEAWSVITTASCTQDGVSIRLCEGCNIFETQIEEAYGHADNNGDGKCDECSVVLETAEPSVPSEPSEPEAPETEKEDANVFSFLTEFLNKLIDFLKSLFKIG